MAVKLYIDHDFDTSGKGKMLSRISPYMEQNGVKLTDYAKADVVLGINKFRRGISKDKKRKIKDKKKRVLRVDGIHLLNTRRNRWANRVIKQDIERADAVIWQSEFCKRVGGGVLGTGKNPYVIWNGANTEFEVKTMGLVSPKNVILAATWYSGGTRKNKRLRDMVRFAEQYRQKHPEVAFHVFGETGGKVEESPAVIWHGHVNEVLLRSYMSLCDCMLYLAFYDWMPNVVVECLCSGTPVISGNQGGQAEVCPYVVDIDDKIPAKLMKTDKTPPIEYGPVREALDTVLYGNFEWELNPDLKAENAAKKYAEVIKSC